MKGTLNQKYLLMARFFLVFLRYMRSFSIIRILSYVHPGILPKNARDFFSTLDDLARAVLEKFLKQRPGENSDDRLVKKAAGIIMQCRHGGEVSQEELEKHAIKYLELKPWNALLELCKLQEDGHLDLSNWRQVDGTALQLVWRLKACSCVLGVTFGLLVAGCWVVGAIAFLLKLCHVAVLLLSDEPNTFAVLTTMFLLLNGIDGIVNVNTLLWWRVELFIFGGSDAQLSTEERYVLDAYLALLFEKLWETDQLRGLGRLAVLVQLDDDDLQQLVVEEDEVAKARTCWHVQNYIKECGHAGHCMRSHLSKLLIGMRD